MAAAELLHDDPVLTFSDIVERTGERVGGFDGDTRTIRMIKRAARDALRDISTKNDWKYYIRSYQISAVAPVDLTVVYTQSTLEAVVSAGTIPSNADLGELYIDSIRCKIESVSGSTITLDSNNNPGADFSGTATWSRSTYRIPRVTKVHGLWRLRSQYKVPYVSPQDVLARDVTFDYTGTPTAFTVSSKSVLGANDLVFSPAPGEAEEYRLSATVAPDYPSVFQATGLATAAADATTLVIPEATSAWVGSIIRAATSSADKLNDIKYGEFDWQAVVVSVTGTDVVVDRAIPVEFAAETVLVSSLIDIDIESMQTYYEAMVYEYYCRNSRNEDLEKAMQLARVLYMSARSADSKSNRSTYSSPYGVSRFAGIFPDLRFASLSDS